MTMEDIRNTTDAQSWEDVMQLTGQEPTRWAAILGAVLMLVFFVEGIVGGLWIIVSVICRRKVWNIINIFIVSLCINDILVMFLIVVLIIDSLIWGRWTAGEVMCKLNPEFTVVFTGCSLWHSALIAIHRYLVVVHNNLYKRISKRAYVIFVLAAARIIPFACTLPGLALDSSGYVPKLLRCILLPKEAARMVTITMVQIVVPCVIVVLCYTLVFAFVVRISRRMQTANRAMKHEIQITKMFGVIFLMIMIGFIPYAAVRNADRDNKLSADIYVFVSVCYGIATCCSPLVYGAMSRELRQTCCMTLKQWLRALRLDKLSPCCLRLFHPNNCFDTSNDMDTYNMSMTPTQHTIARPKDALNNDKHCDNAALITETVELQQHTKTSVNNGTVPDVHLVTSEAESRIKIEARSPDNNATEAGCDETSQLLRNDSNVNQSVPNGHERSDKKYPPSQHDERTTKGVSFSCSTDDCRSGERSREASNISSSQTDTIDNECEVPNVSYEISAFV